MNRVFTIYGPDGLFSHTIDVPDLESVILNTPEGGTAIPGLQDEDTVISPDGAISVIPSKPGPWAAWDGTQWFDPRTPADMAAELQARRAGAKLTTAEFLAAAMSVNLLTPDEAAAAAWGEVPASFQPAVDALTPMQKDMIRVIWPRATIIERLDPFILGVAAALGVSDETLDAMFGLVEYVP